MLHTGGEGRLGYDRSLTNLGDDEHAGADGYVDLGGRNAFDISCGNDHTCAVVEQDDGYTSNVYCW